MLVTMVEVLLFIHESVEEFIVLLEIGIFIPILPILCLISLLLVAIYMIFFPKLSIVKFFIEFVLELFEHCVMLMFLC